MKIRYITPLSLLAITLTAALSLSNMPSSNASNPEEEIGKIYVEFETILNSKNEPEVIMDFLHKTIDQNATFSVEISNNETSNSQKTKSKLTKADYINSYLYGPRMVENYNIEINAEVTKSLPSEGLWMYRTTFIETGNIKDINNLNAKPRPFASITSCDTIHGYNAGKKAISLKESNCVTQISYEQEV